MKQQIADMVEAHWESRYPDLMRLVDERTLQIENLLILEEYHRSGQKGENLKKAMAGFGATALDMGSLSSVLRRGGVSRTMGTERFHRIQTLHQELIKLKGSLEKARPKCRFLEFEEGPDALLEAFDHHIADLAKAFRTLRIAQIEAGARYEPKSHDQFFEDFNWRQLDNGEMILCPPVVVFSEPGVDIGGYLGPALQLLTAGKPLKLVVMRTRLDNTVPETGRAAALKSASEMELLFISLRNVFFFQGSAAGNTPLETLISRGLDSPRPGVFSLYAGPNSQNGMSRSSQALLSRAFPHFEYDPERAAEFVSCLDLSDNPAPEEAWPPYQMEYLTDEGEPEQLEYPLTFADFAAGEEALAGHFTAPNGDVGENQMVPMAEYLQLTVEQRRDKTPFIYSLDAEKHLVRLVPSSSIIAQTADRMHLWHTLQELGGIKNPHVQAAEQKAIERLTAEKEQSLAELKTQLEGQAADREKQAIAGAMKNLALKLTGMAPLAAQQVAGSAPAQEMAAGEGPAVGTDLAPPPESIGSLVTSAPEAPAAAETAVAPVAVSEEPWIETRLCTTCDECIAINKKIFAYDAEKKAIFKDPRGGPYRDIVKGAEKCSSGAIHPGMPLDPEEKDLEKWIKRAEPFQ